MGKQQTDLDKLYSAVSSQFDIGEFEDFRAKMQTPEDRRKFYDAVSSEGFDLGDYDQYEQRLGGATGVSLPGSEDTSQTLEQPSSSSTEPSSGERRQAEFPDVVALVDVPEGQERAGVLSDAYYSLASGSSLAGQMIAGIPQYLYELGSVPFNLLADAVANNAGEEAAAFLRMDYENVKDLPPLQAASKVAKYYGDLSEENRAQVAEFEQGIVESLASGNFSDAGRQVINSIAESVPSMMAMLATSGAGQAAQLGTIGRHALSALPFASGSLQELEGNENIPDAYKPVIAGLHGFSEIVFEQSFGTTALVEEIINNRIGREGVKQFVEGYLQKALSSQGIPIALVRGGASEAATELSNNIIDKYSGVDPDRDLMQGVADATVVGMAMDGGIRGASSLSNAVVGTNRAQAAQLEQEINQEKEDLNNPEVSEQAKNIIQDNLEAKTDQLDGMIEESRSELSKLTPEAQQEVGNLLDRLSDIQEAVQDPNVSEATKTGLQEQAELISTEIDNLITQGEQVNTATEALAEGTAETPVSQEVNNIVWDETKGPQVLPGAPTRQAVSGADPVLHSVADNYAESSGITFNRQSEYVAVDEDRAKRIAEEYEKMEHEPDNPVVKEAYENLIRQTTDQYNALVDGGYEFYFADPNNDPYGGNPWNAVKDLRENKRMAVFPTYAGFGSRITDLDVSNNPMLKETGLVWKDMNGVEHKVLANDLFRAVHDAFGHGLEGAGFRARGEENAWQAHARLFTGSAVGALTTETRGQNSWLNYGKYGEQNRTAKVEDTIFADQKIGLMPEWTWKEGFDEGTPSQKQETQEVADEAQQDTVTEDKQAEVRAQEVEESGAGEAASMPPTERTNPTLKRLIRALPNQDVTRLMGPANVEARRDVIEAVTGTRPTKKDAGIRNVRSTLDEYFGLEGADAARVDAIRNWANAERTEFSSPQEAVRYQAENTDNPDDILRLYEQEPAMDESTDYKSAQISEYIGDSKINLQDYNRYGDANNLTKDIARKRIDPNNKGLNLDVAAQELSESTGVEITPDDIVEFVTSYPTQESFQESAKSETQQLLEDRYRELTGRRITPKALERFRAREAASVTDADLIARDPGMQELGVTPEQVADRQQMEASEGLSTPEAPLPKSLLKGVSDKLKSTGLANSVKIANTEQITSDYGLQGENVNGFIDGDGNIVINSDKATVDTPIHEFAHAWEQAVEKDNPTLHARGMELIQTPEGKPYVDHVKRTQPGLEGNALYKEALAQAIGDSGARLVEGQQRSVIKEWLKAVWDFIATRAGISQMTPQQVANMTLREFTDAVAVDLLSGKPYVKLDNGDIVAQAPAVSEAAMTDADKFMTDFITRMKQKNGINFQGEIDGSLSPQDFNDLITFFRYAQNKGQIDGIQGARDIAKAMGINSPAEVDMAYKLSQAQAKESTGFKKDEVSGETLKNADFAKMSDEEYRDMGRRLVESGQVNPEALVADIIREPRALQPWEVTALQYYRTQIESQISDVQDLVESGDQAAVDAFRFNVGAEAITGYKGMVANMEVINAALFDLEVAMLATANQQSAAFRLRSLMADKDFNVVQYLAEMKARGYVDPKVEARLKELSNELNNVRAKLKRKSEQAEKLAEQIAQGNINQAAKEPERKTKKVRTKKETVDAVNMVLDSLDVSSFALPGIRFQANNTIRFQVSPNDAISAAVSDAVARMKVNVSEGNLSVPDAIEQAVADVDAAVGAGKWDSMKFRSAVANQLVQQSIPLKVKKPYVNSDGILVVPGEYLKGLVREGSDTIDKMVEATNTELGGSFSEYDIRNAISGYGRESAGHRSDLDRKISKAKRVARLLSQVEDLETKGKRLKTAKQVHDNDTEINALKEQVRQLEYDLEMTPEERAQLQEQRYNEQRQKYLQNYIDQVQERIDNKQFAPSTHQNRFEDDAETKRLRAEAEKIKNEFKKEKYKHELENRTRGEKARALAYDVIFNITRGLSAGADFSAIGVQGAIFSFARPRDAFRVVAGSIPGTFSEANYEQYFADMQADPFYELARKHGLNLQLPNFYQSVQEEQFKGGLPTLISDTVIGVAAKGVAKATGRNVDSTVEFAQDKFNPFKIGDRNYSLVLSQIRLDLFKEFVTNQINKRGLDTKMDDADVKRIAEVVNTITMASKVPGLEGKTANDIVSAIIFSARKFVATWKILGGWAPLLMGPNRNPQLFYDAYGKIIGKGLGAMFLAAAIPTAIAGLMKMGQDDDEEDPYFYNPYFFDPRHSDFLKLKMGNTRVSFFQGIDGNVVFATRLATGEYMTSSSKQVRPLNGEGFNKDRLELGWNYISNKFAPTTSVAVRSLQGDRERQEAYGRFKESLYPMWLADIGEQYEDTGSVLQTGSLAAMGIFGLSYNNYGGAEFAKGDGANKAKARSIFQKSGLSVYDPGEGQRSYFDGNKIIKATGKAYKDEYLPAYQEFMTEAVNSNEHKLDRGVHWEVKEGLVKKLKAEAYKYAEIKTSGIYAKGGFNKFSDDGVQYRLLQSQYKLKADYIDRYMQREAKRDRGDARREVMQKLRADGVKPTDAYRDMLIELYLYNNGSRYANERLIEDARRKKITLVKQSDYTSDMEEQEGLFDEY